MLRATMFCVTIVVPSHAYSVYFYDADDCTGVIQSQCIGVDPGTCCLPSGNAGSIYMNCNIGDKWHSGPAASETGWCNCDSAVNGQGPGCVTLQELGGLAGCAGCFG